MYSSLSNGNKVPEDCSISPREISFFVEYKHQDSFFRPSLLSPLGDCDHLHLNGVVEVCFFVGQNGALVVLEYQAFELEDVI